MDVDPPTGQAQLQLFASALEAIHESVVITDADLESPGPRILYANAAFQRMTGYSLDALRGKSPRILQGPRTDRRMLTALRRALALGLSFTGETTNYRQDGGAYRVQWTIEPIRDDAGTVTNFIAIQRDVTETRAQERSLYRLAEALEHVPTTVVIFDYRGRILTVNRAFEGLTGIARPRAEGATVRTLELLPSDLRIARRARRALAQQGHWQGTYECLRRGRAIVEEIAIWRVPGMSAEDVCYIALVQDVTERRQLEAVAQSVRSAETVANLLSELRHELGNPINSIKAALTVVHRGAKTLPPEKTDRYLQAVLKEITRIERLLDSMRRISVRRRLHPTRVALQPFLEDMLELHGLEIRKDGIELALDVGAGLDVLADESALRQVMINLLRNAHQAVRPVAGPRIRIDAQRISNLVRIQVIDNGIGIAPMQKERIFEPFFSSKSNGDGLGLPISRQLLAQMSGTIDIESKSGRGTTVQITLQINADPIDAESGTRDDRSLPRF
ncbi:MAG: PAS domain S-box protein [Acidobacteriota bacterium]